jgi:hypothetical protein
MDGIRNDDQHRPRVNFIRRERDELREKTVDIVRWTSRDLR